MHACTVSFDDATTLLDAVAREDDALHGAVLVTVMPDVDPSASFDLNGKEPPPADWRERRLGRPHLTWVFVGPCSTEQGVGSALLATAMSTCS